MFERKKLDWGEGETSFIEIFDNTDKPGFQFAHATGFNALTYKELLEPLSDNFNVRAVDARGHGFTKLKANPQDMYDWKIYCDDLIKSVELFVEKTQKPIILSGHSMGAASAIQVAAIRPDLVSGLVLVDPVLMTNKIKVIFKIGRKYPLFKNFPIIKQGMMMSEATKKRRRYWKNKEEIFNSYKNKLIFKTWTETTIRNYIDGGTELIGDEAQELIEEGDFRALKLRMGRETISEDILALESIRKSIGEKIELMVDFNQGLNQSDALRRCHALDDMNLSWFEEPILYDDLEGYAKLARELKTPLQIGENFYGPREMYKAIRKQASDLVMPDFMRIGGISGWLRSVPIAAAAGIPVSTHLYPEVAAHMMRITETAHWLEWQSWANPVLQQPYELTKVDKIFYQSTKETNIETLVMMMEKYLIENQNLIHGNQAT